jgi:two-component system NarL family sensor kinase
MPQNCRKEQPAANSCQGHNGLGIYYWQTGNYSEAIKNHLAALSIREKLKDSWASASSFGNLALVYFDNQNSKEAERYGLLGLELGKKNKTEHHCNKLPATAGQCLRGGWQFDKALKMDDEAW